jgi:RNase P/RNase MRP subunit POP5
MKATLRENYRYIVIKIVSKNNLTKEDLISILRNELPVVVGKLNYPSIMPSVAYFDPIHQAAIVRVLNEGAELFRSGLALITSYKIENKNEKIHLMSLYTAGTIRKAKERLNSLI